MQVLSLCWCSSEGHQHVVSVLSVINLRTTFRQWFRFYFLMAWQWKPAITPGALITNPVIFRQTERVKQHNSRSLSQLTREEIASSQNNRDRNLLTINNTTAWIEIHQSPAATVLLMKTQPIARWRPAVSGRNVAIHTQLTENIVRQTVNVNKISEISIFYEIIWINRRSFTMHHLLYINFLYGCSQRLVNSRGSLNETGRLFQYERYQMKWVCDHRSQSQFKQLRKSPKKKISGLQRDSNPWLSVASALAL